MWLELEEPFDRLLADDAAALLPSSYRSLRDPPRRSSSFRLLPGSRRSCSLLRSESLLPTFSFSFLLGSDAIFLFLWCFLSSSESSSLDSLDESLPLLLELEDDDDVLESLRLLLRPRPPPLLFSFSASFRALSLLNRSLKRSSFSFNICIWIK